MAFDGPILATAVVQALAAIPGAYRELKGLLSANDVEPKTALDYLDRLRGHLTGFCEIQAALKEAKELHDLLHHLDNELEHIRHLQAQADEHGRFEESLYPIPKLKAAWQSIRNQDIAELLVRGKRIRYVEAEPLVLDTADCAVSGPAWLVRFIEIQDSVDNLLGQYERGSRSVSLKLSDKTRELVAHVKRCMMEANARIIEEANALGTELQRLQGALAGL